MTTAPDKWRLARLFLLIALPVMVPLWWVNVHASQPQVKLVAALVLLLVPVIAAGLVGANWRARLGYVPVWAQRRPYSRAMAYLLVGCQMIFLLLQMVIGLLGDSGLGITEAFGAVLAGLDALISGGSLPLLLSMFALGLAVNLLIALIQTEIGLFLGSWLADRRLGRQRQTDSE